jgi:Siphovirus ReqiPepy6 Gp37-like protein
MQVFKLDANHFPSDTVSKFKSLVWTERYDSAGEFQLLVEDDVRILSLLPEGTLISHTDTTNVMIVETHQVHRDKKKKLNVMVSGRSFETFAENRVTEGSKVGLYDALDEAIVEVFPAETAENVARNILRTALQPGDASAEDAINNLFVYLSIREPDSPLDHVVKRGQVYARVLEFLKIANAGIKTVRPTVVGGTLDLVIHDGLDIRSSVVFYARNEDLEDAKYLWSNKGYKTHAQVSTYSDARLHRHRDLVSDVTGLERRVLYVEADDLEGDFTPGTSTDVLAGRGQNALDENKRTTLLSAKVTLKARPKFKINYDIGDLVTAHGEFSTIQSMRVTEHILTVDENGVRGYPSLSAI